jgi:hypothetical protein
MTVLERMQIASHAATISLCIVVAVCAGLLTWQGMKALRIVNQPKSGTLAMLNGTILQGRLTIDAMNHVAIHEQNQLGTLDEYIAGLYNQTTATLTALQTIPGHVNGTLNGLTTTAGAATDSLHMLSAHTTTAVDTANTTLGDLDAAIKLHSAQLATSEADFDAVLKPIPAIEANVQNMTFSGAGILQNGKDETDKLVHPNKKKLGFWGSVYAGANVVHKFEPPIF